MHATIVCTVHKKSEYVRNVSVCEVRMRQMPVPHAPCRPLILFCQSSPDSFNIITITNYARIRQTNSTIHSFSLDYFFN